MRQIILVMAQKGHFTPVYETKSKERPGVDKENSAAVRRAKNREAQRRRRSKGGATAVVQPSATIQQASATPRLRQPSTPQPGGKPKCASDLERRLLVTISDDAEDPEVKSEMVEPAQRPVFPERSVFTFVAEVHHVPTVSPQPAEDPETDSPPAGDPGPASADDDDVELASSAPAGDAETVGNSGSASSPPAVGDTEPAGISGSATSAPAVDTEPAGNPEPTVIPQPAEDTEPVSAPAGNPGPAGAALNGDQVRVGVRKRTIAQSLEHLRKRQAERIEVLEVDLDASPDEYISRRRDVKAARIRDMVRERQELQRVEDLRRYEVDCAADVEDGRLVIDLPVYTKQPVEDLDIERPRAEEEAGAAAHQRVSWQRLVAPAPGTRQTSPEEPAALRR